MTTKIQKVTFNDQEISQEEALELLKKWRVTKFAMEAFMAGIGLETPYGILKAHVIELNI